jgi:hypothetical protein
MILLVAALVAVECFGQELRPSSYSTRLLGLGNRSQWQTELAVSNAFEVPTFNGRATNLTLVSQRTDTNTLVVAGFANALGVVNGTYTWDGSWPGWVGVSNGTSIYFQVNQRRWIFYDSNNSAVFSNQGLLPSNSAYLIESLGTVASTNLATKSDLIGIGMDTTTATGIAQGVFGANTSPFTRSLLSATNRTGFVSSFGAWPMDQVDWVFPILNYAKSAGVTNVGGVQNGNTNHYQYYELSYITSVTNDMVLTNVGMYAGGGANGGTVNGSPTLWLFACTDLPESFTLSTSMAGYLWTASYGDLSHVYSASSPVNYEIPGVTVHAGNYLVAIVKFSGGYTWWRGNYFDTNAGNFTFKYPSYMADSATTVVHRADTNRYGSAEMTFSGYSLGRVTNFTGYVEYVQAGVNSNSAAVVTATNTAKTDLIATNGLLVTRLNATNDLLAARINGVTNGASVWTVSGTTTRLANTNTTNVVSCGVLTTAGVSSTASNAQSVNTLALTNAPFCWTNGTGRNVTVYLSRGVVNGITINGSVVATNSTGYFMDEVMTLSLQPNECFSCSVSNDATTNLPLMTTKPF